MLGLLKRFILINYWWVLLGSSFVSAFAGGWAVHKLHQASQLSALSAALEKREENDEKSRKVQISVDRLPDGAASKRLFVSWSRN